MRVRLGDIVLVDLDGGLQHGLITRCNDPSRPEHRMLRRYHDEGVELYCTYALLPSGKEEVVRIKGSSGHNLFSLIRDNLTSCSES